MSQCTDHPILGMCKGDWVAGIKSKAGEFYQMLLRRSGHEIERYYRRALEWARRERKLSRLSMPRCRMCDDSGHWTADCEKVDIQRLGRTEWLQRLRTLNPKLWHRLDDDGALNKYYANCVRWIA